MFYRSCVCTTGSVYGGLGNPRLTYSDKVKLTAGINKVSLLSVAVGLPVSYPFPRLLSVTDDMAKYILTRSIVSSVSNVQNIGLHFETWNTGVLGPITLEGMNSGKWDLSKWKWSCKVSLVCALLLCSF